MVGKYKVITLCGSTHFKEQFLEAQKRLMHAGNIVFINPDQQAVDIAMAMIIDRIILQNRKGDMSFTASTSKTTPSKQGYESL